MIEFLFKLTACLHITKTLKNKYKKIIINKQPTTIMKKNPKKNTKNTPTFQKIYTINKNKKTALYTIQQKKKQNKKTT